MAPPLKQFFLIALIFGFVLVSSFANAARVTRAHDPLPPGLSCHKTDYICGGPDADCAFPCYQYYHYSPGRCEAASPSDPTGTRYCCCVY
ncbi:hypothetical protein MKW94_022718 [Papaver nudicaule]|uniref:Uncharacterized protein n=1 Tax=Papaver nudicaule TaxID=74823 RepID=A0AA42AYB3_PAPNU|nr:hypothetical protein [Papaver nudicaule]